MKEGSKVPRRGNVPKREVLPDPVYGSELVTRLVNNIMLDGKKGVAQKIVYGAFEIVAEKTGKDALEAFEEAMENIMPQLEVKARRVGGATYQVPMEVRPERRRHRLHARGVLRHDMRGGIQLDKLRYEVAWGFPHAADIPGRCEPAQRRA